MATQPTNLSVPSESPRDLKFNAGKIDEFVTSLAQQYIDRFGNAHYTIEGLRQLVLQQIYNLGWNLEGSFQDGGTVTSAGDLLQDESTNIWYRWDDLDTLPKTVPSGSTPESAGGVGEGKWLPVDVSDVLRKDLAKPTGSSLIGYQYPADGSVQRTVQDKLDDSVSVLDFGAKGDGVTDDSVAFREAIATGKTVYVPDTSGDDTGCVYRVSGVDCASIKIIGESQRVEIQPATADTRILNLKGLSPTSPAKGCFIRNISFSSPETPEFQFLDAVLLENSNQCDVSNVTLYRVQLTVIGHNYLRLDKINGIGAKISVTRHSGDSIDNAVGLMIKDSFLAYNSEVDIRNSTDTRIVDTYIANSKDGSTGLNHDFDAEFLPGGTLFFGGVLMITNVICECVCIIKYTALSKFTGFWAGAFHGNGLTLLYSYGLLGTNCTFHYSTGAGVYARNLTDCTFVSSSFTNSEGGGFDLDESIRTTFVACTFSKFELYE
ncbi:glycosyl hydrolase family 28-related protein [Enterobacter hormaechei subsp. oharae]